MRALWVAAFVLLAGCFHAPAPPVADGDAAPEAARLFALAKEQVEYPNGTARYRTPGTAGNLEVAEWIAGNLQVLGATARLVNFTAPYRCEGNLAMRNVEGVLPGKSNRTIYLSAHFDTRPVADKDPDVAKRTQPVLGANDGASGVAVVLELARLLAATPSRNHTYVFLLFDGEDGGATSPSDACNGKWALGSDRYAKDMSARAVAEAHALLLFDLVGDKDLELRKEGYTASGPGKAIQARIWQIAKAKGHESVFRDLSSHEILDDHKPFLDRGVRAVDLLHLDGGSDPFPASHHTTFDDLEHLSGEKMRVVADVAWAWVREQESGA